MKKEDYTGCWVCDNLVSHPEQLGLLYLGFPRCFVLMPSSDEFYVSDYDSWRDNLSEVNWLDPSDKGTPAEQENVLMKLWNFSVMQEQEEDRIAEENGYYGD